MRAHGEGVDVANDFGNWNGSHHTQGVGLGHLASNHTRHVSAFVGAAVVCAHVVGCFVTCSMLKLDFFVVCSNLQHGVHVAKGGAENHFVALAGQVAEDALCIGAFWHFFYKASDNFVAKLFFEFFASVVVSECPTTVAHGANVSKCHFERLCLGSRLGFFFFTASH